LSRPTKGHSLKENFFFTFLLDHRLEGGDDFVAACHQPVNLILAQIWFGAFPDLVSSEVF
jgi:hypothetical protein